MFESKVAIEIENLYSKVRSFVMEFKAFDPQVTDSPEGKSLISSMRKLHNKLAFTTLTNDRLLLSITGMQGSGKSTLLARLYNLDPDYLPENKGRGEQIPVLISERENITTPICYVRRLVESNETFKMVNQEISKETFYKTCLNPGRNDIWVELLMPYTYLNDDRKSIVLLPGFEKDENQVSQEMLNHILALSTSSILVLRKDTYARQSNEEQFKAIHTLF